tara:strand:+ start:332 stop:718 length:387 start_codon:yes stop_codon:yes gene_type:complete
MILIPSAFTVIFDTFMAITSSIQGGAYESFAMAVHPMFYVGILLLLILPLVNFFYIYYEKKNSFLLKVLNFIVTIFFALIWAGFLSSIYENGMEDEWLFLFITMIFFTFGFSYTYISGIERFWLKSDE